MPGKWPAALLLTSILCLAARAQQPAAPSGTSAKSDLVVARVSGEPITESQVLSTIEVLARQTLLKPDQRSQRNTLLFKSALENLVTLAMLKSEAGKRQIEADPAKVEEQMKQYESRYPSKEEFLKALAGQGTSEAELRKGTEVNLRIQQLLDLAAKDTAPVADEEMRKFYESNLDKFALPERAHVAQIFLKKEPDSTPERRAEIRKKLEGIRADIEAGKISFSAAAEQFSEDEARTSAGGDLGFVPRGRMIKALEDALYATAPGGMTPVVESQTGFHLIEVKEIRTAGMRSFEEAQPEIRQHLEQAAKQQLVQKFVNELKAAAVVETFMDAEEFARRHP